MANRADAVAAGSCALMCALGLSTALSASSLPLARNPIVTAVHHQNCAAAVKLINADVRDNDAPTAFLAGRMLDEGICVQRDPQLAARYFAHAAELGDRAAVLDYAAKAGLGIGTDQDYARAGELCRAAGVDTGKQLPTAVLGYACTVSAVAGRLLRERLPAGAFSPVAGAVAKVEFTPASGALEITSLPTVGRSDPPTGSYVRQPVIDAGHEIDKAWREALQMVPAPAAAHTETHAAALVVDVDMTLEQGHEKISGELQRLMPGDVHPTTTQSH